MNFLWFHIFLADSESTYEFQAKFQLDIIHFYSHTWKDSNLKLTTSSQSRFIAIYIKYNFHFHVWHSLLFFSHYLLLVVLAFSIMSSRFGQPLLLRSFVLLILKWKSYIWFTHKLTFLFFFVSLFPFSCFNFVLTLQKTILITFLSFGFLFYFQGRALQIKYWFWVASRLPFLCFFFSHYPLLAISNILLHFQQPFVLGSGSLSASSHSFVALFARKMFIKKT